MFAFICLLLTACGSFSATALSVRNSEPLHLSLRPDPARALTLQNSKVTNEVYDLAAPLAPARDVHVPLDGQLARRVRQAPHDLIGGKPSQARPLDTRALKKGRHVRRVTFAYRDERNAEVKRLFTFANSPPTPLKPTAERWHPKPGLTWQWQLQGKLELSLTVDVYDIDLFDTPASTIETLQARGKRVICYFSAGSFEPWREDAAAFPAALKGKKMDGWDELWLDIRNPGLKPIMRARLGLAAQKGCDGVEPDNVDAYANDSGFPLIGADQLAYNRFLAAEAHAWGLAIGLKNDLDQVKALEPYFDFAVNEQCFQYRECEMLKPFIRAGKAVFGAEYERSTAAFCPVTTALGLETIEKRYDLGAYLETCQ